MQGRLRSSPHRRKLKELKLHGLAAAWVEQQAQSDYAGLGFDERLGLLVDAEWLTRNNARLKRNIKEAHLKVGSACLEDLDYEDRSVIDKPLIRQLATCQWVARPRPERHARVAPLRPSGGVHDGRPWCSR